MQGTKSDSLCEALRIMQIRSTPQLPRRSANLWLDMVKPKLCEVESALEVSTLSLTSKRRYGVKVEGNFVGVHNGMKSISFLV
ncbi:MAG: hypothetical protein ACYTFW_21820 [Planctomycetota bacterium]|jgi:hypothetical protein